MTRKTVCQAIAPLLILLLTRPVAGELTDEQVRQAIRRGVAFLVNEQKSDGSWTNYSIYSGGVTALATLALLSAGEEASSPAVKKALQHLRSLEAPDNVYSASLQTMALCAAEPDKDRVLIARNVKWLEDVQLRSGNRAGAWGYGVNKGSGDNSNTQFALLALHEAARIGVDVKRQTWERSLDYWTRTQREDGAWGYTEGEPATGSMTCAGIASVVICASMIGDGDARVVGETVECCGTQPDGGAVDRGLQWLGRHFSASRNPSPLNLRQTHLFYYLYAVERVGRMTGQRFIGRHDWYRAGCASLLEIHDDFRGLWVGAGPAEDVPVVATSLALLFLAKGRRPVLLSKLQYGEGNGWDLHRQAVQKLTSRVESRWKRDLSWQTVNLRSASVMDLLETPVLFISGRDAFTLSPEQKENLRQYVNQGGFIFAERCCGGEGFDRSFRALMRELFEGQELRLLPPDHPIWYAEERVNPKYLRPLLGIEACCRTSVVYSPQDLSCYWELHRGVRNKDFPRAVQEEIEACLRIGENVVTYATGRELKNKLDRPLVALAQPTPELERSALQIPKLIHDGGSDDAPNALPNLLNFLRSQTQLRAAVENEPIAATSPHLFNYPILFIHGRRDFRFSPADRAALAEFLERGGVIFGDAICGNRAFAEAFRREMQTILPGRNFSRIEPEHAMFTPEFRGYDLRKVRLRDPQARAADDPLKANVTEVAPYLEGLMTDDHYAVIFSPYDLSCALENSQSLECKGYVKEDAVRLATNVVLFLLQQ